MPKTIISLKKGIPKTKRSWEELVSLGLNLREDKDKTQWQLGDLSLQVEKDYSADSLGKFSVEIGINKTTLATYRTCSGFYPKKTRDEFASLGHSFFQTAMRNNSLEEARAWLTVAHDCNWSCEGLRLDMDDKKDETETKKIDKMFLAISKTLDKAVTQFGKSTYLNSMIENLEQNLIKIKAELKEQRKKK